MESKKVDNVCVIGLGYVGLTLAVTLAEKGLTVFGIEKNEKILGDLKKGKSHFHEKGLNELIQKTKGTTLLLSKEIPAGKAINCFIIAVSTPIDAITKLPRIDYIEKATQEIVPHLQPGQLVVLRSTIPVGATRNVVLPILQKKCSGFYLSFCPERTAEGKALEELKTLPQVVGGLDEASTDAAVELFSKISPLIVRTESLEVAEIVKLVNNSYRDMMFAYANQIALICKSLHLDAKDVIDAANLGYPRADIKLPGLVGGFCLEKDPYILMTSAKSDISLIKAAKQINENTIYHILASIKSHVTRKPLKDVKFFISGFAFKGDPETDDLRSSQAIKLLELLKKNKANNILGHDFIVSQKQMKNLGVVPVSIEKGLKEADVAVFMNNHRSYANVNMELLAKKMKKGSLIFDGWHIFPEQLKHNDHIAYESIGFSKRVEKI